MNMEKKELKKKISEFAEMEARSGQKDRVTPEYVARVAGLNASLDEIVAAMKELEAEGKRYYY